MLISRVIWLMSVGLGVREGRTTLTNLNPIRNYLFEGDEMKIVCSWCRSGRRRRIFSLFVVLSHSSGTCVQELHCGPSGL